MNMISEALSRTSSLFFFFIFLLFTTTPSSSSIDSFIYGGCTQLKFAPGSVYESNVNSILTSVVNSASSTNFNNFKISLPGSTQSDIVYGLFQCRGDLSNSDCHDCVVHAVSQLGTLCVGTSGGALQLEGCFVKYDNISFLGVSDKAVISKKCGPLIGGGYESDTLTRRDAVMAYLAGGAQYFRVGGSGKVQGMAQCVQDLNMGACQDCLSEAIGRLRSDCGESAWGDMFLAKCYVRYSERGYNSRSGENNNNNNNNNNEDTEKTLAIIIGLIAGVAVIIVLLSALSKLCDKKGGGK